jgi:hypothetical protein
MWCADLSRLPVSRTLPGIQKREGAGDVPLVPCRKHSRRALSKNDRRSKGSTLPEVTMPATMIAAAANNFMWISCPNTSARKNCFGSFFVRPDGVTTGRLRRHVAGVLISNVSPGKQFYDSSVAWRDRASRGRLHSGTIVIDARSAARKRL